MIPNGQEWFQSRQFADLQRFIDAVADNDDLDLLCSTIADRAVRLHREFEEEQESRKVYH